jgi:hypothetical protein
MARIKSATELEEARQDSMQFAWTGSNQLDRSRLLLIYARQSSQKQLVYNVQSAKQQTEDAVERAIMLGWTLPYNPNEPDNIAGRYLVLVENSVAKKCSGTLPIDSRPGLNDILENYIRKGLASGVLVVAVDRLFRDEDGIDSAKFAKACKIAKTVVITPYTIFDFHAPYSTAKNEFVRQAEIGADFIKYHIKGRMLGNRTRKAEREFLVANGIAPVGLRVQDGKLVPTSHAPKVNWLHVRFQELDASRNRLLNEVLAMARRGEPLFPVADDIDPKSMFLTEVWQDGILLGWTIKSLFGLTHVLGNPSYQGHLVFNGKVVKRSVFTAIVDKDAWQFAHENLAERDLNGELIERPDRASRYEQKISSIPNLALLAGNRHDGRAVIEGMEGESVYVSKAEKTNTVYTIRRFDALEDYAFVASVDIGVLDRAFEQHLLTRLFSGEFLYNCDGRKPDGAIVNLVHDSDNKQETTEPDDTLETINSGIASIQRKLDVASDVMDAEEIRKAYEKLARLKQRRQREEEALNQTASKQAELAQAHDDIQTAQEKYTSWNLERRRRFIRLITDSIILERVEDSWLRLTVNWSALVGGNSEECYLWRASSAKWSPEEHETLLAMYSSSDVSDILKALPTRAWSSIQARAGIYGIKRTNWRNNSGLSRETSLADLQVLEKYGLKPDQRAQWKVRNSIGRSPLLAPLD